MHRFRLSAIGAAISMSLTACVSTVDPTVSGPEEDESIFLIGAAPQNCQVGVFPIQRKDGKVGQTIRPAVAHLDSVDGFIIGRAKAGEEIGIVYEIWRDENGITGTMYKACNGSLMPTFVVPRGKVVYLGSFQYSPQGRRLPYEYSFDIEGARNFLRANYKNLPDKLEAGKFELTPSMDSCTTTIYISVPSTAR